MSLSFEQIRERLAARFGEAVGATVAAKDPFVVVKSERLLEVHALSPRTAAGRGG